MSLQVRWDMKRRDTFFVFVCMAFGSMIFMYMELLQFRIVVFVLGVGEGGRGGIGKGQWRERENEENYYKEDRFRAGF